MENKSLERKSNKGWDKINKNQNMLGYLLNFFSYKEVSNFKIVNKNLFQVINKKQDWSTDFQNQRRTECQILFEMGVLLRMGISALDGTKPVKTINFPSFENGQNFLPESVRDDNILWIFKKFNESFVRPKNKDDYNKYNEQIENQENPTRHFDLYDPASFELLRKNLIKSAGYTEEKLKNMKFPGWTKEKVPSQETVKAECRTENSY